MVVAVNPERPGKLTEAELDRAIDFAYNDDWIRGACVTNQCDSGRKPCPTPDKCVIYLDNTWPVRFTRMLRSLGRWLMGPRP